MLLIAYLSAALLMGDPQPAKESPKDTPGLSCMIGPAKRTFGGTDWLVFSCNDPSTMVVVSDSGNPASPFYFILSKVEGHYKIYGEGNGDKKASDSAGDELSHLDQIQLDALLAATKQAPKT